MIFLNSGSNPQNVYFDGTSVNNVYYNGTLVWSRSSGGTGGIYDMPSADYDAAFGIPSGFDDEATSSLATVTRASGRIDYYRTLAFATYYVETDSTGAITSQGAAYSCQATVELFWNQLTGIGAGFSVDYLQLFSQGTESRSSESGFPSITWYNEAISDGTVTVTLWADLIGMSVIDTSRLTTRTYTGKLHTYKGGKYIKFAPVGDEYGIYTKTTGYAFQGAMSLYTTFTSS